MYISAQDLTEVMSESTLISLSNDTSRAQEADQVVLTKACEYATETVDGYLRSRYVLPLNQVPTIVRNICLQLARFWLYSRRPDGKGFPDNVKETHTQALKDLERIQNGKLHLGLTELGSADDDNLPSALKFKARAPQKLDLSGY
ncbi:gp436 family protein [Rodentibacter abscessus]|uniref:gp436 family protein n=1 Tax=Rodentibacter abscessus TaxID=3381777 RepID=UPI00399C9643